MFEFFCELVGEMKEKERKEEEGKEYFEDIIGIKNSEQLEYVQRQLKDFKYLDRLVLLIKLLGQEEVMGLL